MCKKGAAVNYSCKHKCSCYKSSKTSRLNNLKFTEDDIQTHFHNINTLGHAFEMSGIVININATEFKTGRSFLLSFISS